jgi:DNA polymerase
MFIGEAPGYAEDKYGVPFIGKSGELLQKYLNLCNFPRNEIYITNVVKCRPPCNRQPTVIEIKNCKVHLLNEIATIKPKLIVLLGSVAFHTIFPNYTASLINIRGVWIPNKINFLLTYHPSYVLRQPKANVEYTKHFISIVHKYREVVDKYHAVKF